MNSQSIHGIYSINGHLWTGVQMQELKESSFDNPSVLAIVILPHTERSLCDQILKSVLSLFIFWGEVFRLTKLIIICP